MYPQHQSGDKKMKENIGNKGPTFQNKKIPFSEVNITDKTPTAVHDQRNK